MSPVVRRLTLGAGLSLALLACDPDSEPDPDAGDSPPTDGGVESSDPPPCNVEPVTSCPDPAPRFADVQPIFKERCSACHVDNWSGPWPLDTYQHIADWASTIRDMVRSCTMPPPEAGTPLPEEEAEKILTWIYCKTPR